MTPLSPGHYHLRGAILGVLLLILAAPTWGLAVTDSWIFRSEVSPGQSMTAPGPAQRLDLEDNYVYRSGIFTTGFEWTVKLDPGTLSGNVEGVVSARYADRLSAPGWTSVTLSHQGLTHESRLQGTIRAQVTGKPYVGVAMPWPIPDINAGVPIKVVDVDLSMSEDFTTGLDAEIGASTAYEGLKFDVSAGLLSAEFGLSFYNRFRFTPEAYQGTLQARHLGSGFTLQEQDVYFATDTSTVTLPLYLDKPGYWAVELKDFGLSDNSYVNESGVSLSADAGVPLLGTGIGFEVHPLAQFNDPNPFALRFERHYDTGERVGQFIVQVDAIPLPPTVWLLASTLLPLIFLEVEAARNKGSPWSDSEVAGTV